MAAILLLYAGGGLVQARQFTSGVNVVEVYASVTDRQGQPVKGLTRDDFEVREDGQPQAIATFTAGNVPLAVAIGIDRSFSMAGERLATALGAARAFLDVLQPGDESMLLAIGSTIDVVAPLSNDRQRQARALGAVDAFGTTGLHDAIIASIDAVQPAKGRRALVLLSDGDDRYSQASAVDALERARRADVMVYGVALGRTRPPLFVELATLTGGRSFHARDPKALPETVRTIAQELREQYLIGYVPSRPIVAGAGEWRSISVSVKRPDLKVRARDGYLVR